MLLVVTATLAYLGWLNLVEIKQSVKKPPPPLI
jgi:hypothetical protein